MLYFRERALKHQETIQEALHKFGKTCETVLDFELSRANSSLQLNGGTEKCKKKLSRILSEEAFLTFAEDRDRR